MSWKLFGSEVDIGLDYHHEVSPYLTKKQMDIYAPQTTRTTTWSPTQVQDYTFAPQYIISSPHAQAVTKKEGASAQPSVTVTPTQTVSPGMSDVYGKSYQDAPFKVGTEGGILDGVTGLFVIGALAVGGIVALKMLSKAPKSKVGLVKKVIK